MRHLSDFGYDRFDGFAFCSLGSFVFEFLAFVGECCFVCVDANGRFIGIVDYRTIFGDIVANTDKFSNTFDRYVIKLTETAMDFGSRNLVLLFVSADRVADAFDVGQ